MVASYTGRLRLTKQGTNDNPNTWGDVVNAQIVELLDEAVSGVASIDCTGSSDIDLSLTTANGATDDARHAVLELSGVLGADINLILPSVEKIYIIKASHTGGFTITVKPSGGASGIAFSNGDISLLYTNGTSITEVTATGALQSSNNLSDVGSAATSRTNLGLGTIATQNANNVNITGGTISGVTGVGDVTSVAGRIGAVVLSNTDISGLGALATQNTVDATTDITNLATQLGFGSTYTTADQTFIAGTTHTYAHGLGSAPTLAIFELVCTTANNGYSIGERIPFSNFFAANSGFRAAGYDATNVFYTIASGISYISNKGATGFFTPSPTQWQVNVRAWA